MTIEEAIKGLKAKDERIEAQSSVIIACQNAILQKDEHITNLSAERDKYNTIAANLQISRQKAYDNIAELEAIIEKMKCCENCESHTNVGSKCLLDIEDSLECRANNYSNWKLKSNVFVRLAILLISSALVVIRLLLFLFTKKSNSSFSCWSVKFLFCLRASPIQSAIFSASF